MMIEFCGAGTLVDKEFNPVRKPILPIKTTCPQIRESVRYGRPCSSVFVAFYLCVGALKPPHDLGKLPLVWMSEALPLSPTYIPLYCPLRDLELLEERCPRSDPLLEGIVPLALVALTSHSPSTSSLPLSPCCPALPTSSVRGSTP
jgi:hypothetical protein